MSNDLGPQKLITQKKQTTHMEPISNNLGPQQLSISTSRMTMMAPSSSNPGPQNLSVPNKRLAQVISMPNSSGSHHGKRNSQTEPSPKGNSESSESVRGKLRESLAASLALVSKQQSKAEGDNSQSETASTLKSDNENPHLANDISKSLDVGSSHIPDKPVVDLSSKEEDCASRVSNWKSSSQEISVNDNTEGATQTSKPDEQEFQLNYILLDEDASLKDNFLVKDEFLQGNGLCWASDLHIEVPEETESRAKKPKVVHEEVGGEGDGQSLQSPQALATRIEAELFKLFGGVNKKYKEKGRSLLFNLKDRNNPDLRERVISGEIPPDRLCSMTAEELASKELSRWRIAKAEELAQMVVLPDSEVNVRRLVKKTHKGEFQVEFEQDDGASVEVAVEASSLSQYRPTTNEKDAQTPSNRNASVTSEAPTHAEANTQDQNLQSSVITLSNDSSDLMQGLVVDELKDAEFLPPIVSLDEFMESLDSEPPFQDLPIDDGKVILNSDEKTSSEDGSKLESSDLPSVGLVDTSPNKPDTTDMKRTRTETDGTLISNNIEKELEASSPGCASKQDFVWEGLLQLNVSAVVTVNSYFKSGEKTSVKEWPHFLDVKGRVRLDAFEKFLQELPMSRSRAIMIVHFCWKEGSSESGHVNLSEVTDSYIIDERVGFAEPVSGVELYLCPPHKRTLEMLGEKLPKDHTEMLNAVNDGLIGIVVWRKPHVTSTISPKSSSHNKHSSKKQYSSLRRQQEANTSGTYIPPHPINQPATKPLDDEPIDDVPPGFGPAATMDEDDLPEFDFVGGTNLPVSHSSAPRLGMTPPQPPAQPPPRPVEQMRELIHKYGHSETSSSRGNQKNQGAGIEIHPWNDDDDIPEWEPQLQSQPPLPPPTALQQQQMPPPPPAHNPIAPQLMQNHRQQFNMPPQMGNQQHFVSMPMPSQQQLPLQYPSQPLMSQRPLPMQPPPLQPPTNMLMMQQGQQHVASAWQHVTIWTPQPGQSIQGNTSMIQSCNSSGQQFHGPPTSLNGMEWRPSDVSRSRKF